MLCSQCLANTTRRRDVFGGRWLNASLLFLQGVGGWLILGYAFYLVGKALLSIPHDFHEGSFWQNG